MKQCKTCGNLIVSTGECVKKIYSSLHEIDFPESAKRAISNDKKIENECELYIE